MDFAFNELSFESAENLTDGQLLQIMDALVKLLHELKKHSSDLYILTPSTIYSSQAIQKWLNSSSVRMEHKRVMLTIRNKHSITINEEDYQGEFEIAFDEGKKNAIGCLVAYEENIPAISVASTDAWSKNEIRGYHRVDNEQEEVSVKNIYEASQVADIIEENINRKNFELRKNIYSGQDLWENRKELYPRLILCENVKEQIYRKNGKYIKQVMAKLQILNDYFASYDGKYNPNELGLDVSNESESVSQESSLKAMRLFQKPDGEKAYFFEHIKFKSGTRIHYLPCDSLKICYIGYIGIHLRTKLH